jgi:TolB-like protein
MWSAFVKIRKPVLLALTALAVLAAAGPARAATNLAVFNFQLKTGQEDWVWLEKFMSDQMATDLVQDRSLSVVARDRMQLMAQQMKWVPEFATGDAKVMGGIRSQLQIEYLVTGVCSVQGDQLEITAQIVEVQTRKEVHRKTVTGKTDQVIDLQKQLSADAMAWFTKKPAGEILKTLPMWTRSIPAVRALYEGMHLYDQGRYAEGWLKFRESSREDKNYVEAVYWVGKMYYFMYRYDHARRTLERFVYLNCLHPRMGDALMEYVHTFENSGATPEELLAMYKAFGERFPNANVWVGAMESGTTREGAVWAKIKSSLLLRRLGRYRESATIIGPATDGMGNFYPWAVLSLLLHNATTGELLPDEAIMAGRTGSVLSGGGPFLKTAILRYEPGQSRRQHRLVQPVKIAGQGDDNPDKEALFCKDNTEFELYLLAPSGYVFKSLRFEPVTRGNEATMAVSLHLPCMAKDIDDPKAVSIEDLRANGLVFRSLPRTGMLTAEFLFRSNDDRSRSVLIEGVDIIATFEKLTQHGAIDVQCMDTYNFRVDVDGVFGRWFPGPVGLLLPGEHTLTFRPAEPNSPYADWTTQATVVAGQVTRVMGRLPWKPRKATDSVVTALVGERYDSYDLRVSPSWSAPAIQMDDLTIRMVWSRGGDLWSAISTDGNSFSTPRKLPLPVSSAWDESDPRLLRDESGRFVLTFISDRDGQHRSIVYICWSRDFVNWSEPAMISDRSCNTYDIVMDSSGRLVCAIGTEILSSRDGFQWNPMSVASKGSKSGAINQVRLLPRDNGRIELFAIREIQPFRTTPPPLQVLRFVSQDGLVWSQPEILAEYRMGGYYGPCLSAAACDKGAAIFIGNRKRNSKISRVRMVTGAPPKWDSSGEVWGFMPGPGSMAFHPRWGYVLASMSGSGRTQFTHEDYGPYMMRSPDMPALLCDVGGSKPVVAAPKPECAMHRSYWIGRSSRRISVTAWWDPPSKPGTSTSAPRPELPRAKLGEIRYVATTDRNWGVLLGATGAEHFTKSSANSGTVNPNARVVTLRRRQGYDIAVALDSTNPSSTHYDVLRIDITGKGNFTDAAVVHRSAMVHELGTDAYFTEFVSGSVDFTIAGTVVPRGVYATYMDDASPALWLTVRTVGQSQCRFGKAVRKVCIFDTNNTLTLGDAATVDDPNGYDQVVVYRDGEQETCATYGMPVLVDGTLYDVTLSTDSKIVTTKPYTGLVGNLRINHVRWKAFLESDSSKHTITAGAAPISVPPGKYTLRNYEEYSSADPNEACYMLKWYGDNRAVEIQAGKTTDIVVGSPAVTTLITTVSGRSVTFRYYNKDVGGKYVSIDGPKATDYRYPYLRIVDSNRRPVYGGNMDWEGPVECYAKWSLPDGLSGTFTAIVEYNPGPFIPKPATATFTVK